jgi:hypothetical protein
MVALIQITDQHPLGQIREVGTELRQSLRAALGVGPSEAVSAQVIRRRYGMNSVFCHRLTSALRSADPIATIHQLPGPESLRRFVEVARGVDRPADALARVLGAVESFEALIRSVAGDRSGLDAIISSEIPDARARLESEAKQAIYRGARQIKGIAADAVLCTAVLRPSEDDPDRLDMVVVRSYFGLRRVRLVANFTLKITSAATEARAFARTLDGRPMRESARDALLKEFCTGSGERVRATEIGDTIVYSVDWGSEIGLSSAHDTVLAELRRTGPRRYRLTDDPRPRTGLSDAIHVPSRRYIFDVILHRDAYPEWRPSVRILETGEQGRATANDPTRDLDVIDVHESIRSLGLGLQQCRVNELPQYSEILSHVYKRVGWDAAEFRTYRTEIEYPIFGSQIQHRFDLPVRPA